MHHVGPGIGDDPRCKPRPGVPLFAPALGDTGLVWSNWGSCAGLSLVGDTLSRGDNMSSPDRVVRPPKRQRHQHSVGDNGFLNTITSGYSLCPAGRTTHAVTAAPKTDALSRCGAGASPTNNAQPPIPRGGVGYDHWKGERQKVVAGRDADLNYRDRLVLLVNKRDGSMRQADRPHGPMCVAGWRVPQPARSGQEPHTPGATKSFVAGWR